MKLDCLVVDDEPNAGKLLEDYINKIPGLTLIARCFDGKEALEVIRNSHVDLLFLDINMPNLNGIELMSFIPKELPIIFTTAYSEYAIESYEYHVIDYLLKPITFNRFMKAIGKASVAGRQAEEQISGSFHKKSLTEQPMVDEGYFFVRADKKMIKINFDEILYFEAVKEYICIHTEHQKVLVYKRMKDLAEKLPDYFIRVHNSYIINCKCIKKIEGNIVAIGNLDIPLGVSYRNKFLEFIQSRAL